MIFQVVFKKEVKIKEPQQRNSFSKRTGQFQLTNKWRGKKETEPEIDPDGRPHHKVTHWNYFKILRFKVPEQHTASLSKLQVEG